MSVLTSSLGMTSQKRAAIDKVADTIRKACGVSTPVNASKLVETLGGKLEEKPNLDYEARITRRGNSSFTITLDRKPGANRKQFSVAHEIGHLVLHMGYLLNKQLWQGSEEFTDSVYYRSGHTEEEREADEFAAALLMPREEFVLIAKSHQSPRGYDLTKIAGHFHVSNDAALNRGRWIGMFRWE